jgi:hypothetical protein
MGGGGQSNEEIDLILGIGDHTVKNQLAKIPEAGGRKPICCCRGHQRRHANDEILRFAANTLSRQNFALMQASQDLCADSNLGVSALG